MSNPNEAVTRGLMPACGFILYCAAITLAAAQSANDAYPPAIAAWTPARKQSQREAAEQLLKDIRSAIAGGRREFRIAPGDYRFNRHGPTCFRLQGVSDFVLDGQGATFWFDGRYRIDAMQIVRCRNLTIRGLTIDYNPLPFSQGEIVAVDSKGKSVDVRIDPGFLVPSPEWVKTVGKIKAIFYDGSGRQVEVRMDWVKTIEPLADRVVRVTFKFGWIFDPIYGNRVRAGHWLIFPDRSMRHTFALSECEGIVLENVTVYACPQMAFAEVGGRGGNVYRGCRVVRRPNTRRLLACNADALHSIMVEQGPLIEGCEFCHAGDDFVNIHGFFAMVYERRSPTQTVVVSQYSRKCFSVESMLRFYRIDDLSPLAPRRVKAMQWLRDRTLFQSAKRMPAELRRHGKRVRDFHPRNVYPFLVDLDGPTKAEKYDLVGCEDLVGAGAVVRSNYFHDGFARGVVLCSRQVRVEGNRFERTGMASVAMAAQRFWLEGPFPHDIDIRNNSIIDSGTMFLSRNWNTSLLGAVSVVSVGGNTLSPGMQNHDIHIVGNHIVRPAACGIALCNAQDCEVVGNTIEAPCSKKPVRFGRGLGLDNPAYAIFLAAVDNVTLAGNKVLLPTQYCRGALGKGKWVKRVDAQNARVPGYRAMEQRRTVAIATSGSVTR